MVDADHLALLVIVSPEYEAEVGHKKKPTVTDSGPTGSHRCTLSRCHIAFDRSTAFARHCDTSAPQAFSF